MSWGCSIIHVTIWLVMLSVFVTTQETMVRESGNQGQSASLAHWELNDKTCLKFVTIFVRDCLDLKHFCWLAHFLLFSCLILLIINPFIVAPHPYVFSCVGVCAMVYVRRLKDNWWKSVLCFHHVCLGHCTQLLVSAESALPYWAISLAQLINFEGVASPTTPCSGIHSDY